MRSFEAEDAGGDVVEISISPNRFSDAASHTGIARELAAILRLPSAGIEERERAVAFPAKLGKVSVNVLDPKLCPRYSARRFKLGKTGAELPAWLRSALISCGLKSISPVVDIMNYVMLEVGQPLHAFDAAKLSGGNDAPEIVVRRAKKGESIAALDGEKYVLTEDMLVIADAQQPLAVAGIKGGEDSGVSGGTRVIVVEAANFDPVNIFKTSRRLGLQTDASTRFAHGLSPELVRVGMDRVTTLLGELCGAELLSAADVYTRKQGAEIIGFSVERFNALTGLSLTKPVIVDYLKRLGFKTNPRLNNLRSVKFSLKSKKEGHSFLVSVPPLRTDISIPEDLFEEVARLYGYSKIAPAPPVVGITPSETDEYFVLKQLVRDILTGLGLSEVYNSSFSDRGHGEVELTNPIAGGRGFLRNSLMDGLRKNCHDNMRFSDVVRVFEIGKVFGLENGVIKERWSLGLDFAGKKREPFFELKGTIGSLFEKLGISNFNIREASNLGFLIDVGNDTVGEGANVEGRDRNFAFAELDMEELAKKLNEEREFAPLPKYPAIQRDISLLLNASVKAGTVLQKIQDISPRYVENADVVDYFEDKKLGEGKKSLSFRIVFRSDDRTLTDAEADAEVKKIISALVAEFGAEAR